MTGLYAPWVDWILFVLMRLAIYTDTHMGDGGQMVDDAAWG